MTTQCTVWMSALLTIAAVVSRKTVRDDDPKPSARPYKVAHDESLDAVQMLESETDDYRRFRVEFSGIEKDRVPAFHYRPKRAGVKAPAVLLQYGSGGNKRTDYIVAIGQQFVTRGYEVLTIDSPQRGERKPKDGKSGGSLLGAEGRNLFLQYCGDYSRAIDYLAARPEIDGDRIGYVGISLGAITGLTFVAHEPRVRAMASLVGGGNFLAKVPPDMPDSATRLPPADAAREFDPVYHVARMAPRPLLFLNAKRDQLILHLWAQSVHKVAGPGSQVVWIDADHYFNGVDRHGICEAVIDFMDDALAGRAPPRVPNPADFTPRNTTNGRRLVPGRSLDWPA